MRSAALGLAGCLIALAASAGPIPRPVSKTPVSKTRSAQAAKPAQSVPLKTYGSKNAPITFEVFTDYECPMCRTLYQQTLRPMISEYAAAGKVYVIHRDYPIGRPDHKYSGQAARWANAAAEVGQFGKAEAALYDYQTSWEQDGSMEKYVAAALSRSDFERVRKRMGGCQSPGPGGLPGTFIPAPHPCALDGYIQEDVELGNQLALKATPTFVISYKGRRITTASGYVSWPVLKQFFDNLLRQP